MSDTTTAQLQSLAKTSELEISLMTHEEVAQRLIDLKSTCPEFYGLQQMSYEQIAQLDIREAATRLLDIRQIILRSA